MMVFTLPDKDMRQHVADKYVGLMYWVARERIDYTQYWERRLRNGEMKTVPVITYSPLPLKEKDDGIQESVCMAIERLPKYFRKNWVKTINRLARIVLERGETPDINDLQERVARNMVYSLVRTCAYDYRRWKRFIPRPVGRGNASLERKMERSNEPVVAYANPRQHRTMWRMEYLLFGLEENTKRVARLLAHDYGPTDIADVLDISRSQVYNLIKMLRKHLEGLKPPDLGFEPDPEIDTPRDEFVGACESPLYQRLMKAIDVTHEWYEDVYGIPHPKQPTPAEEIKEKHPFVGFARADNWHHWRVFRGKYGTVRTLYAPPKECRHDRVEMDMDTYLQGFMNDDWKFIVGKHGTVRCLYAP